MSDGTDIYIATETFSTTVDGVPILVKKNETRVRDGHELLKRNGQFFKRVDDAIQFDVETATAEPGEKRGRRKVGAGQAGEND